MGHERVAVTADHNGFAVKERVVAWLRERGHEVDDRAPALSGEPVDYPALCEDVCRRVLAGAVSFAVVVGGSGQGEQIACNKIRGIRAALCNEDFATGIARAHNDANVMVIGAKVVGPDDADGLLGIWCDTVFEEGPHRRRLDQIAILERGGTLLRDGG